jgi:quercetin dioxygenase-like cupin family protein
MEILPERPTANAPAERFTGVAYIDQIVHGQAPSRVRAALVRFTPGARNGWHAHAVGQTVHVTDGVGRIQSRGGEVVEMREGTPSSRPPGSGTGTGRRPIGS